jgi:hypothetical protein
MAQHDMGPSRVAGFVQQCRKCKALDREIQFALGPNCPVEDPPSEPMTSSQVALLLQAQWFSGYFNRQSRKIV